MNQPGEAEQRSYLRRNSLRTDPKTFKDLADDFQGELLRLSGGQNMGKDNKNMHPRAGRSHQ